MKKSILFMLLFFFTNPLSASIANDNVKIKARKIGQYVVVEGWNKNPFSISVIYKANYSNLKSDKALPIKFVLKAHTNKKEVLRLKIVERDFSFKAHYDWLSKS